MSTKHSGFDEWVDTVPVSFGLDSEFPSHDVLDLMEDAWNAALAQPLHKAAPDLLEALERASRKLSAYVGVCAGDKELTDTVLPMVRAAIAKAKGEA